MEKKTEKRCNECGEVKPRSAFRDKEGRGMDSKCKACRIKYLKEHYDDRKVPRIERIATYSKKHGLPFVGRGKLRKWFEEQPTICCYCGQQLEDSGREANSVTIDRVIPEKGYVIENLVISCHRCNRVKSDVLSFEEMKEVAQMYDLRHRH